MIKLTRIDDRLLHGQIAFTWVPALGIDCLMIANDKIADDDFLKMTYKLAKPPAVRLAIVNISDAVKLLLDAKTKGLKILVLVNSVQDAASLASAVGEINSVNFGGLRSRDGAHPVSKAIALTADDQEMVHKMLQNGIELEVRQVPTDKKLLLQDLIK